jgi:hypothetical protein
VICGYVFRKRLIGYRGAPVPVVFSSKAPRYGQVALYYQASGQHGADIKLFLRVSSRLLKKYLIPQALTAHIKENRQNIGPSRMTIF